MSKATAVSAGVKIPLEPWKSKKSSWLCRERPLQQLVRKEGERAGPCSAAARAQEPVATDHRFPSWLRIALVFVLSAVTPLNAVMKRLFQQTASCQAEFESGGLWRALQCVLAQDIRPARVSKVSRAHWIQPVLQRSVPGAQTRTHALVAGTRLGMHEREHVDHWESDGSVWDCCKLPQIPYFHHLMAKRSFWEHFGKNHRLWF